MANKVYGVGFGQTGNAYLPGYWKNEHFTELSDAAFFFGQKLAEFEKVFQRDFKKITIEATKPGSIANEKTSYMITVRIGHIKTNGKPGKIHADVSLYSFENPVCTFACTACESLRKG